MLVEHRRRKTLATGNVGSSSGERTSDEMEELESVDNTGMMVIDAFGETTLASVSDS